MIYDAKTLVLQGSLVQNYHVTIAVGLERFFHYEYLKGIPHLLHCYISLSSLFFFYQYNLSERSCKVVAVLESARALPTLALGASLGRRVCRPGP